jgi:hypothetical protein
MARPGIANAMKLFPCLAWLLILAPSVPADELASGFASPPIGARPRAFWNWLNGDVDHRSLSRDLQEAKEKGMGGLEMWDCEAMRNPGGFVPAGPPFMGPESVAAIRHSLREAGRHGLEMSLLSSSGWNAGGPWVPPAMASKNLLVSEMILEGPGAIRRRLPFPEVPPECPKGADGRPLWSLEVAVLAWPENPRKKIRDAAGVIDLTTKVKDGELSWDVPAGPWRVARFVCTNNGQQLIAASPNSKGLFIDFLDPKATRFHFELILDRIGLKKGGDPSPLKYLEVDSMELHPGIQWTPEFPAWFGNQHGYSPLPWLPVLAGWTMGDEKTSERFQYDYRKSVSDLLISSHYTTGSEVCAEYGLGLAGEAGGPGPPVWNTCPVDSLKALGNVTYPRGEFWIDNPGNRTSIFLIKEVASAAHIYGKPIVEAESWTTWRRWRDGPFALKRHVDRAFCEGLNRIVYHGFANSPEKFGHPGRAYHAGVDLNPRVTWWGKSRPFMDYLARCCHMLQQGRFVADVAYFYGDQAPNFWPMHHDVPEKPLLPGLGAGYDYDVVNSDVILNHMTVNDGRIELESGMSYRVLVLPEQETMPLEVLAKLDELVRNGATIIGPKPKDVPGLHEHEKRSRELRALADTMWGACDGVAVKENRHGTGKVVSGITPREWLAGEGIGPDFSAIDRQVAGLLDSIHRRTDDADIYFVRNSSMVPIRTDCVFRVMDSAPQLWDPGDGRIHDVAGFRKVAGGMLVPIDLAPGGSIFVVFGKQRSEAAPPDPGIANPSTLRSIAIGGPWRVAFDPAWGAPPGVDFQQLGSWSDHPDPGVKYYSGTAAYHKVLELPANWGGDGRRVFLDLGEAREVAEIFVNGRSAGILWKPPYRTDVTGLLKPGQNELKIEVVNLWINRLAGDAGLPPEQRFTRTNITSDGSRNPEPWQPLPSGLFGPVRLLLD